MAANRTAEILIACFRNQELLVEQAAQVSPCLAQCTFFPSAGVGSYAEVKTQACAVRSLLCATLPCGRPRFGRVGYRGPERRQIADWSVDDGPMWGLCCQFCCEFPTPGQSLRVQAASTTYQGLQARHSHFFSEQMRRRAKQRHALAFSFPDRKAS